MTKELPYLYKRFWYCALNRRFFGAEWIHCNAKLGKVPKLKIYEREEKEEIIPFRSHYQNLLLYLRMGVMYHDHVQFYPFCKQGLSYSCMKQGFSRCNEGYIDHPHAAFKVVRARQEQ
jgi:hypothetical protein